MRDRERQLWTDYVRGREQREKPARKRQIKQPEPTQAELEAALDDLTNFSAQPKNNPTWST
jgi:hypothetical protein